MNEDVVETGGNSVEALQGSKGGAQIQPLDKVWDEAFSGRGLLVKLVISTTFACFNKEHVCNKEGTSLQA